MFSIRSPQTPVPIHAADPLFLRVATVRVACGFPSPADDHLDDPIDLVDRLTPNRHATFLFEVQGDSMAGADVHDGDVAIVDRSLVAASGQLVVACVAGGFTLKLLRIASGRARLWSVPRSGPPRPFGVGEEVQVWGVVRSTVTPHMRPR